ncbi:MAG: hemin uptake protein HemP [Pseudomonadota bacterium]
MKHEIVFVKPQPVYRSQPGTPEYAAEELTAGGRRATITLGEQVYTLQITKQGKLLLTK